MKFPCKVIRDKAHSRRACENLRGKAHEFDKIVFSVPLALSRALRRGTGHIPMMLDTPVTADLAGKDAAVLGDRAGWRRCKQIHVILTGGISAVTYVRMMRHESALACQASSRHQRDAHRAKRQRVRPGAGGHWYYPSVKRQANEPTARE